MSPLQLPPDYPRIRLVESFAELLNTPFANGINALCWPRALAGDFQEVLASLPVEEGIQPLDPATLEGLDLSVEGRRAVETMLADVRCLEEAGLDPTLDCIHAYPRDDEADIVPVHVYSFHVDSAPVIADTWLCTYAGPCSESLRNDEAIPRVDEPATRAALLREYGGEEGEGFREYLAEHCYDLHYSPLPGARPFPFGIGNLWRIANQCPGSPVPPCIHRAPDQRPGSPSRLLLIS